MSLPDLQNRPFYLLFLFVSKQYFQPTGDFWMRISGPISSSRPVCVKQTRLAKLAQFDSQLWVANFSHHWLFLIRPKIKQTKKGTFIPFGRLVGGFASCTITAGGVWLFHKLQKSNKKLDPQLYVWSPGFIFPSRMDAKLSGGLLALLMYSNNWEPAGYLGRKPIRSPV